MACGLQKRQIVGGAVRFVLTESGHVAGVINPAANGKYPHWVAEHLPKQTDQWFCTGARKGRFLVVGLGCLVAGQLLDNAPVVNQTASSLTPAPVTMVKRRLETM